MSLLENVFQLFNSDGLRIGDVTFLFQLLKEVDISMQVPVLLISSVTI